MKTISLFFCLLLSTLFLYSFTATNSPDKWEPGNFNYTDTSFTVGQTKVINVIFNMDNGKLLPESELVLDSVVDFMKKNPNLLMEIAHHTDSRGNDKYNLQLSIRRAAAVKSYIDEKLGDHNRMTSRGAGESELIFSDEYISQNGLSKEEKEKLHSQNRRTILTIKSVKYKKD